MRQWQTALPRWQQQAGTGSIWHRTMCGLKVRTYAVVLGFVALIIVIVVPSVIAKQRSSSPPGPAQVDWTQISASHDDRLPDFSFCGYHASDKPLPDTGSRAAAVTISPQQDGSSDDTQRIQEALDATGAGGGGVVALGAGDFRLSPSGLDIPSGVVLRGAGANETRLAVTGQLGNSPLISLGNKTTRSVPPLATAPIVDKYVPIGASLVTVADATAFQAGQYVFVQRAVTAEWIRANGMADLVRDGVTQTWLTPGVVVRQARQISAIRDNTIALTVPLVDALDADFMQPTLVSYNQPAGVATELGIEGLSITVSPTCSGASLDSSKCNGAGISFLPWAADGWARDLQLQGFNNFVHVSTNASRITVQNVTMRRDGDSTGAALPGDIIVEGSQVLVADCAQAGQASARSFAYMTESLTSGPNALLRHDVPSSNQIISPHQRWAQGLLVEDTAAPVYLVNRATNGTGHGWAINAAVGWNLRGDTVVQSPPLGTSWCVGCVSVDSRTNGSLVDVGNTVIPKSLFAAQLQARSNRTLS